MSPIVVRFWNDFVQIMTGALYHLNCLQVTSHFCQYYYIFYNLLLSSLAGNFIATVMLRLASVRAHGNCVVNTPNYFVFVQVKMYKCVWSRFCILRNLTRNQIFFLIYC